MSRRRYLTKSRFKLACECPTKLYYTGKAEYANQSLGDSFLQSLAEGGFQVGELAKCYFPGGHDITTLDYEESLAQTNELMQLDEVVIFEAAISYQNLFIRADVLKKLGNRIFLYEVKAKSIDLSKGEPFHGRGEFLKSKWKPYLYDIAFQKYVTENAFPHCSVSAHLMLTNKEAKAPTSGLNQKFLLINNEHGRREAIVTTPLTEEEVSSKILCSINVDRECDEIYNGTDSRDLNMSFVERIQTYGEYYEHDTRIPSPVSTVCGACEFYASTSEAKAGKLDGKKQCWKECLGWSDEDFNDATVFDVWNFRKKSKLIPQGVLKMNELTEEVIAPKHDDKAGISASERQWLQVEKDNNADSSAWLDKEGLQDEFDSWTYPLHFIDFETTAVAIPFTKGMRPYESVAFQFSHHTVYEDGRVEHKSEFLNTQRGVFPSFDFLRALKRSLEHDEGTIFRYSNHENTILNLIYRQLEESEETIPDLDELLSFIQSITRSTSDSVQSWVGTRNMVDMWDLVKRYYYDPATNGSNSIKHVLPAMMNSSEYLQQKYSKPIYGASDGIQSLNFNDWTWIQFENGSVKDPYKLLPKMFQDIDEQEFELLSEANELKDGGAALTAYAKMQFAEMSDYEREELSKALLKYCELDTFAMVMIYEGWREMLKG